MLHLYCIIYIIIKVTQNVIGYWFIFKKSLKKVICLRIYKSCHENFAISLHPLTITELATLQTTYTLNNCFHTSRSCTNLFVSTILTHLCCIQTFTIYLFLVFLCNLLLGNSFCYSFCYYHLIHSYMAIPPTPLSSTLSSSLFFTPSEFQTISFLTMPPARLKKLISLAFVLNSLYSCHSLTTI